MIEKFKIWGNITANINKNFIILTYFESNLFLLRNVYDLTIYWNKFDLFKIYFNRFTIFIIKFKYTVYLNLSYYFFLIKIN